MKINGHKDSLVKIATDMEKMGYYKEASEIDTLIKEAGFWDDKILPVINYVKNWGADKLKEYVDARPNTFIANLVKKFTGSGEPTAADINNVAIQAEQERVQNQTGTEQQDAPTYQEPTVDQTEMIPVQQEVIEEKTDVEPVPDVDESVEQIAPTEDKVTTLAKAIEQQSLVRLSYQRQYDGGTKIYNVTPDQVKRMANGKFWAFHDGTIHSFTIDRINDAKIITG